MIDHFKKSKNFIDQLKKIEKSIDRSISLKKSDQLVSKNRSSDRSNDQRRENGKLYVILFSFGFWHIASGHLEYSLGKKKIEKNWKKNQSFQN